MEGRGDPRFLESKSVWLKANCERANLGLSGLCHKRSALFLRLYHTPSALLLFFDRHRHRLQRIVVVVSGDDDDLVYNLHASKDLAKDRIGPIQAADVVHIVKIYQGF